MITEKDLVEAITECQGERNPNANTCIKLAAYYTIKEHLYPSQEVQSAYSYSMAPLEANLEDYYSKSDFSQAVKEKGIAKAFPVIDELMDTLIYLNPKLYDSVLRKIEEL